MGATLPRRVMDHGAIMFPLACRLTLRFMKLLRAMNQMNVFFCRVFASYEAWSGWLHRIQGPVWPRHWCFRYFRVKCKLSTILEWMLRWVKVVSCFHIKPYHKFVTPRARTEDGGREGTYQWLKRRSCLCAACPRSTNLHGRQQHSWLQMWFAPLKFHPLSSLKYETAIWETNSSSI